MRPVNNLLLNAVSANATTNSAPVWAYDIVRASFQVVATSSTTGGTLQLQGSNDQAYGLPPNQFIPTNWTNIGSASTVSGTSPVLISEVECSYEYLRVVYTDTAAGVQTVSPVADTGVKQVQTVTTVADVAGSLNSKYFLLSSVNLSSKAQKNFYLWLDDGGGVDPAIAGRTGIHVTYSDNDSANTIATAIRSALNALTNDFVATGSNAAVIITNKAYGLVTAAADGTAATGFTFANTTPGVVSNLTGTYFLLSSGNDTRSYYVWFNVDTISTDPAPAGKTAITVAINSGSSAGTIGTAMATAIGLAHSSGDFTTSGTTTVQVTNQATGPFTPASDVNTTFTIALTTPLGTVSCRMKAMAL